MRTEKHNPDYKLVGKRVLNPQGKAVELVYGISNDGTNEGLEVYHYNDNGGHYSRRYINHEYPNKYRADFVALRQFVRDGKVPDGHKLSIN